MLDVVIVTLAQVHKSTDLFALLFESISADIEIEKCAYHEK